MLHKLVGEALSIYFLFPKQVSKLHLMCIQGFYSTKRLDVLGGRSFIPSGPAHSGCQRPANATASDEYISIAKGLSAKNKENKRKLMFVFPEKKNVASEAQSLS